MNISGASQASGVSQRMIRHYEKVGLVPPPARRDSGYRDYSETDVHRLRFIANARDLGFPIEEIRALLDLWTDRHRASGEVKALAERRAADLVWGARLPHLKRCAKVSSNWRPIARAATARIARFSSGWKNSVGAKRWNITLTWAQMVRGGLPKARDRIVLLQPGQFERGYSGCLGAGEHGRAADA